MHVYAGSGRSLIGETELRWTQGDTIAVPAWTPVVHEADAGSNVRLFKFDDRPLLTALEAYRCDEGPRA
jgi:gentisate 1,2-dioxygenase